MAILRVGVVGAGTIAQVEHIPNLLHLRDRFDLAAVADPSPTARSFIETRYGLKTYPAAEHLLQLPLDAVLICSPDPLHHEQTLAALAAGMHVFCEKPLCYSAAEIDQIIAARDFARRVVQVGYMKRFDPNYEAALTQIPGSRASLRYISVEVNDPDAWPFIGHYATSFGKDVPANLIAAGREKQAQQIRAAIGGAADDVAVRGFATAYCSSLVHDVNAVHGLLEILGVPDGDIVGAQIFAKGDGGQGAVSLLAGQALWNMCHLTVPSLADYKERIALYFDDSVLELEFPSPWLNHHPTRVVTRTSDGHIWRQTEIRAGFEEAFVRELAAFWDACVNGTPPRNPPEHARRDQALLCGLARRHIETRKAL